MNVLRSLLDKAALTLHAGLLTAALGDRGAVVFVLLVESLVPDSLAFCLWLAPALSWSVQPSRLALTRAQFIALIACLAVAGATGVMFSLVRMAARRPVRTR